MRLSKDLNPYFLFVGFTILYYWGSFSKVPLGDCIGFIADTEKGNFILSTSVYAHFLFSNTLILLHKLLPFVESIEIGRWFTLILGASTVTILYKIILKITSENWPSFLGAILMGLSFSFWRNSEIVEIYTFNAFLISLFILFAVKFIYNKNDKHLLFAAFILGISLWNHIQNILMIPGLFYLFYLSKKRTVTIQSITLFSLLFLGLFFIPILKGEELSIVFKSNHSDHSVNFSHILTDLSKSIFYLIYNFWHFLFLGLWGFYLLLKRNLILALFLIISALPVYGFATLFSVSDNYVFFIPFNLIFATFISIGIKEFYQKGYKKSLLTVFLIPAFYWLAFKVILKTEVGSNFNQEKKYKGGLAYYMLPWLKNNVGILELTLDKTKTSESIDWMKKSANDYIKIKKSKGYTIEELKEQ